MLFNDWYKKNEKALNSQPAPNSELSDLLYADMPDYIEDVSIVKIAGHKIKTVCDVRVPKGEIHFVLDGKCVVKITNVGESV